MSWMRWKMEKIIPGENKQDEPGKITWYQLHEDLFLFLIDIRSYKIPEILPSKTENETPSTFYINYCTKGRCELYKKDGCVTFLESGELAIDSGHTVHVNSSYCYPNREYQGIELCFHPGKHLDQALSLGTEVSVATSRFRDFYMMQDRLLITRPEERIREALDILKKDAALKMPKNILLMDVCRLLALLGNLQFTEEKRRTYYTDSQVKIAKLTMKELSENLSKRISAAELAARFGISESSLKNYFRGVYGKGYHEYLNELRMKKAADMLMQGGFKVGEIAVAVGYANQSRFAKAFKGYFGIAPTEYSRRMYLRKEARSD